MQLTTPSIYRQKTTELFWAGDKQAFDQLYNQYAPLLYGMICRLTEDLEQAEQILKQTFITSWENRATYRSAHKSFLGTMLHTARKISLSLTKSNDIVEKITQIENQDTPDCVNRGSTYTIGANNGYSETEIEDKVLQMTYVHGKRPQEVAKYLNITPGEVIGIVRSAINRFKVNGNE